MENSNDENDTKNIMNIYLLNGENKESWDLFNLDITKDNPNENIIFYLKNKIKEEPNNELTLDIIDFIIDKGSNSIIDKLFNQDFFDLLTNQTIEINNNNSKIKDKSLFLIKKWVDKFKDKYILLIEKYNKYKNEGQIFPEIIDKTYNNYIQIDEEKKNKGENKDIYDFDYLKDQINNIEKENKINNENSNKKTDEENNTNFNSLDNPFEDNYGNLLENIDFPEDDQFQNKFSNLRTSEIPTYFKTLRSKSIVENTTILKSKNPNQNFNQNNIRENNENNIIEENNENNIIKENDEKIENNGGVNKIDNEQNKKEIKQPTNMNDIFNNNNKNDNYTSTFKNYKSNPILFQNKWNEKILSLNKWIKEGKNSKNFETLKEGIKQLLIGLDEIEEIIQTCAKIGDNEGRTKVSCIKSDMEQTCYRYECLLQGKKVEKFKSSFDGNVKKYYFYKPGLLEENNININEIEDEKKEKKMKKFGRAIKNSFLKVGKKIKSSSKEKKVKSLDNIGILDDE